MYRRVALTATVACGALLFIGHLKRKFRRNACAAVRVFIHQLQKVRHETLKVTWFVKRGLADADALRALLDPRVELVVVTTGRLADVDAATEILVSGDAPPYDADPGGLARLARLEAFLRAAQESEIPNFKGSDLGHFPLVSADFWTSDHLSERSRSVDVFPVTRARGTLTLKRR